MYQSSLNADGIECILLNDTVATTLTQVYIDIELKVRKKDMIEAKKRIEEIRLEIENKELQDFRDADHEDIAFEKRLNEEKSKIYSGWFIFIILLIIFIYLLSFC
ncbi:MAG TPA: hypothetical protein PK147_07820 [Saprospiraceae bacterium]|nr:hypothetical protein [Saprospiraceae bacterium]